MTKAWLRIFQIELISGGVVLLYGKFILNALAGRERVQKLENLPVFPLLTFTGVLLISLAAAIFIPQIGRWLRTNRVAARVIPMHILMIVVLFGVEALLRITVYNQPLAYIQTNGFGSLPAEGSSYLWGREGYALTKYEGFPGEIRTPFRGGEHIFLLGDSFLEGLQVSDDEKLASIAETMLKQDGYAIDLHNMGASGMSAADYAAFIPRYIQLYHPEMFILVVQENDFIESFDPGKDNHFIADGSTITDSVTISAPGAEYSAAQKPHLVLRPVLFQYGRTRLEQMIGGGGSAKEEAGAAGEELNPALIRQQLDILIEACGDTPLMILIYPHAPYIAGNRVEMVDEKYENLRGILMEYPQITLVDPLPALQELTRAGTLPMGFFNSAAPGRGHLNTAGNRVVGEVLAAAIQKAFE